MQLAMGKVSLQTAAHLPIANCILPIAYFFRTVGTGLSVFK